MNEAPVETPGPFSWAKYRLNGLKGLDWLSSSWILVLLPLGEGGA